MMDDREFDELVDAMKNRHNPPPETPRERIWERIDAARSKRRDHLVHGRAADHAPPQDETVLRPDFTAGRRFTAARIWRMAAAAAAVLVLGIAIGRMTLPGDGPPGNMASGDGPLTQREAPVLFDDPTDDPPVTNPSTGDRPRRDAARADLLYRKAASDLFGRADALLTGFKVTPCAEQDLAAVPDWAGGMLVQTRLLLGTPVADTPEMRDLLLDLELVLAQIVGISKDNCARDAAWIRDALTENATIDRMRLLQPELTGNKTPGKAI